MDTVDQVKDNILNGRVKFDDLPPIIQKFMDPEGDSFIPTAYNIIAAPVVTNIAKRSYGQDPQEVYSPNEIDAIFGEASSNIEHDIGLSEIMARRNSRAVNTETPVPSPVPAPAHKPVASPVPAPAHKPVASPASNPDHKPGNRIIYSNRANEDWINLFTDEERDVLMNGMWPEGVEVRHGNPPQIKHTVIEKTESRKDPVKPLKHTVIEKPEPRKDPVKPSANQVIANTSPASYADRAATEDPTSTAADPRAKAYPTESYGKALLATVKRDVQNGTLPKPAKKSTTDNRNEGQKSTPESGSRRAAVAAAVLGAAALGTVGIYMLLRSIRKKKKKSKNIGRGAEKRADWNWNTFAGPVAGFIARQIPEGDLIDMAMTAKTKEDYKKFNDTFRKLALERWNREHFLMNGQPPSEYFVTCPDPIYLPGENRRILSSMAGMPFHNAVGAIVAQDMHGSDHRPYGIQPDMRTVPFTALASTMLRSVTSGDPKPRIGNMSYIAPFINGQYALDNDFTKDEVNAVVDPDNREVLDNMIIEGLKHQMAKYPAVKNIVSAYVNGGFGDVNDPEGFGLERQFWDYTSNAPTQEGSNILKKVVGDIALSGGYGGQLKDTYSENPGPTTGYDRKAQKEHYRQLLKYFDSIGPHIFMPKTVLGKEMLYHPTGGIVANGTKAYEDYKPYFDNDPELYDKINGAVGHNGLSKFRETVLGLAKKVINPF